MPRSTTRRTPAATATVAPMSAQERLAAMSKKKPVTNQKDKSEKVKLELPDTLKPAFIRFAGQNLAYKTIEEIQEAEKAPLLDFAFNNFIDKLWAAKSRPATMEVEVKDDQGRLDSCANYIVQARFKITLPDPKDEETHDEAAIKAIAAALHATGVEKEDAEATATRFVNNELDLSKKAKIDLDKWSRGREEGKGTNKTWVEASPEERDMANRVLQRLMGDNDVVVTQEEIEKVVEFEYKPAVKPGFFERVATYAKCKDQLKVLFTFIKPTNFFSGVEFAKNSNPQEKIERQVENFRSMIGVPE